MQKLIDSLNLNTLSDRLTLVEICEYDIDIANICITAIGKLIHVWLPTWNPQSRGCMCVCVCVCVRVCACVYVYIYDIRRRHKVLETTSRVKKLLAAT